MAEWGTTSDWMRKYQRKGLKVCRNQLGGRGEGDWFCFPGRLAKWGLCTMWVWWAQQCYCTCCSGKYSDLSHRSHSPPALCWCHVARYAPATTLLNEIGNTHGHTYRLWPISVSPRLCTVYVCTYVCVCLCTYEKFNKSFPNAKVKNILHPVTSTKTGAELQSSVFGVHQYA